MIKIVGNKIEVEKLFDLLFYFFNPGTIRKEIIEGESKLRLLIGESVIEERDLETFLSLIRDVRTKGLLFQGEIE